MKKTLVSIALTAALALCGCASAQNGTTGGTSSSNTGSESTATSQATLAYRYATASEGKDLLLSNEAYYAGFSQNDLDFRMQKSGATMDELKAFAAEQVLDFTDEEKAKLDERLAEMTGVLAERCYSLPPLDEIVFVKTTMAEECDAGGYTHGTTIFLGEYLFEMWAEGEEAGEDTSLVTELLWHEIFHCLTRCNPDFRTDMYKLIHFTTHDTDYALSPSVFEYHISNPDVEHHDASAVFNIDGKDIECFTDFVTLEHFGKKGDNFFELGVVALVPVDGSDVYYRASQAANFDDVFGRNTDYIIDPEECMADNFAYTMTYGIEGQDGEGYKTPEIIEGIIAYLSK